MKLEVFKNAGFEIRGGIINREPYFVLADVCKALDIKNVSDVKDRLKKDGVVISEVIDSLGRTQQATFINESNLYKTIFQSRKEEALIFQEWVTSEVLPTIRKHGGYLTPEKVEEALLNPDTIIQLATQLKAERAKKEEALAVIEEQKPRIEFANKLQKCEGSLSVQDFAKVICDKGMPMGQNRLFAKLRFYGLIDSRNKPYQEYVDRGYFAVKEGTYKNQTTGDDIVYLQTRITAKGQEYIYKKLTEQKSA